MANFTDVYFRPRSGELAGVFNILVNLDIRPNSGSGVIMNDVTLSNASVKFYSKWLNGQASEPTLTKVPTRIQEPATPLTVVNRKIFVNISPNELKLFNECDYMEIVNNGRTDTFTFSRFNLLRGQSSTLWGSYEESSELSRIVASAQISFNATQNHDLSLFNSFDSSSYKMYLTSIEGIDNLSGINFPVTLPLGSFLDTVMGTIEPESTITAKYKIGRIISGNEEKSVTFTQVGEITTPSENTPTPTQTFQVLITKVVGQADQEPTIFYDFVPSPTAAQFTNFKIKQRQILPTAGNFQERTITNYQTRSVNGFRVAVGDRIQIQGQLTDSEGNVYVSEFYDFRVAQDAILSDPNLYTELELQASKIFVSKLTHNSVEVDVINDFFNDEIVTSVQLTVTDGTTSKSEVTENRFTSSKITISETGLIADTKYTAIISSVIDEESIEIGTFEFMTLPTPITNPTPEQKEEEALTHIIRENLEVDLTKDIEVLSIDVRRNIVEEILHQKLNADSLGLVNDRNRRNRKGSIYSNGNADSVRTNYPRTIEGILSLVSATVPDIDEGYEV